MARATSPTVKPYLASLVRLEPDTHGVAHGTEHGTVAHAGHALELVHHVDLHPVVDIDLVVAAVRRVIGEGLATWAGERLTTVTPWRRTSSGRRVWARLTLLLTLTKAMSGLVPREK